MKISRIKTFCVVHHSSVSTCCHITTCLSLIPWKDFRRGITRVKTLNRLSHWEKIYWITLHKHLERERVSQIIAFIWRGKLSECRPFCKAIKTEQIVERERDINLSIEIDRKYFSLISEKIICEKSFCEGCKVPLFKQREINFH